MHTDRHNDNGTYTIFALLISIGAIIAAFRDSLPHTGAWILLAALPLTWYIMWTLGINRSIIPATIGKGRYGVYTTAIFLLSLTIPLFGIALEWAVRSYFKLGHTIGNYLSPWILLNAMSECAMLMVAMFGMALGDFFFRWRAEMRAQRKIGKILDERLARFRERISPEELLESLDGVVEACWISADDAAARLRELSKNLRSRLYDNQEKQEPLSFPSTEISPLESFIISSRFAPARIMVLELMIAMISVTAFFITPDRPDFSSSGFMGFAGMVAVMNFLIFGNILLTRHFIRNGRIAQYLIGAGIFILLTGIVMIVTQYFSYDQMFTGEGLPIYYPVLSTMASLAAIALVLGGVTAFMALQQWIRERRNVILLKTETASLQLSMLQSQINPHFLFNVLNNVGMLFYESTEEAEDMLRELRTLLEYQLGDAEKTSTTVGEEADFIQSFLCLEKTRKDPFDFTVKVDDEVRRLSIPTLLLIPFVENASKHSNIVDGRRDIDISMTTSRNEFVFVCTNTFNPLEEKTEKKVGGLGIQNTLQRLQLIFDKQFSLTQRIENKTFKTTLIIPIK